MPLPEHAQLLGVVKKIIKDDQIVKKNQILSELRKEKNNRALQIACQHCNQKIKLN